MSSLAAKFSIPVVFAGVTGFIERVVRARRRNAAGAFFAVALVIGVRLSLTSFPLACGRGTGEDGSRRPSATGSPLPLRDPLPAMDRSAGHPLVGATEHWEAILEDAAATAGEYRDRGWTALELRPGDVTVDPDLPGFDVLLADNEFVEVTDLLGGTGVESYRVYRGAAAGVVFAVVALEDAAGERVALVPLYYAHTDLPTLQPAAEAAGRLATRLRTLDRRSFVVEHEDPEPFFPDEGETDEDGPDRVDEAGTDGRDDGGE